MRELEAGQSKKVLNSDSFTKIKQVQLFNILNLQSLESVLGYYGMNGLFQNTMGWFANKAFPSHVMMANTLPSNRKKMYPTAIYLLLVKIFSFSSKTEQQKQQVVFVENQHIWRKEAYACNWDLGPLKSEAVFSLGSLFPLNALDLNLTELGGDSYWSY